MAAVASFDALERRKEIELLAEETDRLFEQIQARHARLHPRGIEEPSEAVQDDRVPTGMEPFFNVPRNHLMWALSLEVRVIQVQSTTLS